MIKTREDAFKLLTTYTQSESLIKHALSVEAAMLWYAKYFSCNEDECLDWQICGLLHDFDYEQFPDSTAPDGHPYKGNQILKEHQVSEEICTAIMGHAPYTNTPRETQMAKTLFAVDELAGLITAATLVRPDKSLLTLALKSVKKKMKDKGFAKGCNRDDIIQGAIELEVELGQHIENTIAGMREIASELGLAGA